MSSTSGFGLTPSKTETSVRRSRAFSARPAATTPPSVTSNGRVIPAPPRSRPAYRWLQARAPYGSGPRRCARFRLRRSYGLLVRVVYLVLSGIHRCRGGTPHELRREPLECETTGG